jgi:hypothetical protein
VYSPGFTVVFTEKSPRRKCRNCSEAVVLAVGTPWYALRVSFVLPLLHFTAPVARSTGFYPGHVLITSRLCVAVIVCPML